ncbi:helix-turn-helix domain-containing protein [Flavobacterium nitrogenifigens]|uniref:Transcriptional regulator, AraC family n=1 Tax=Flavobacterium nitrogenifigens TaxID=1617283 RepID=A0A521CIP5_9FLAO|nr:helix-turn-helix domain-containing protein [Flavobacterium nitrogenifigens]KAF2328539.1 AraC family transcriptional regulator [Flavobacterium nitrogenifigens]SMO59262.1 transcriptional regulator, AraC family [Flavobacterium nitrogenifigens]
MQVSPPKELSPYIKHYLFLDNAETAMQKFRLFSDGNTGLVFSVKSKLISGINKQQIKDYLPVSFLYGQLNGFKDLYSENEITLIIVVFQPNGIHQLLGIPANEFHDAIIPVEDIFDEKITVLQESLFQQNNQIRVELLNSFFRSLLASKTASNQFIVDHSLNFIINNKGQFSIKQLVKYTGYTERHLERKFKECVGLNPKKFGNVVRLHHFLKLLKDKPNDANITTICYDAGFSDQSHLIKEFKKHTGITPTEYVYNTGKLTNNLIKRTF